MRYFALALVLVIPFGGDAEAQRPNRARQNLDRILERTLEQQRPNDERTRTRQPVDDDRHDRGRMDRWPQTHRPGWRDQRLRHRYPFGSYYAVPYSGYGFGFYAAGPDVDAERRETEARELEKTITTGVLRLEVTPASGLEYYVDGVYIGSSSNLGTEFELTIGVRRVEVRAAGYKPLVFDVRVNPGGQTTFRGALEPLPYSPPPQATGNRTMYIIPGCYVGNSPPSPTALRAGCDIKNLLTR